MLDVYEPVGDSEVDRPLVVVAHGGAFVSGSRDDTKAYCIEFAKRGYVVANMSYRLIDALVFDSTQMFEAVIMSINDMRAAVRYFKEDADNANTYKISSQLIFAAGVSAGGVMASHLGFFDKDDVVPEYLQTTIDKHGGFEGNSSDNTQYSSSVAGVLNYSGALIRDYWIDSNDVSVYSAHDDLDPTVPCGYDDSAILPFPAYIYGSCSMKERLDEVGIINQLFLVQNSTGHVSYFQDAIKTEEVLSESFSFLKAIICETSVGITQSPKGLISVNIFPNPVNDQLFIETDQRIISLQISNVMGQVCYINQNLNEHSIDLHQLNSGIYLIRIENERGLWTSKFIKE